MDSDSLIQRAKEKDPKAFDALYRTYYPMMLGVCINIIREDKATASDLVHDAFVLAFVSIGSLRDSTKFSEWLTTIVRNVALKHVRQRDRLRTLSISSVNEEDAVFADSSLSPEADLSHKELLELISQLPEGYGKVLRLSVIEGFSHREIADMLGIEPHSSSSQLTRAKRLLRRMIDGRLVGVIALLLVPIAWYFVSRHEERLQQNDTPLTDVRNDGQAKAGKDDSHTVQHDSSDMHKTTIIPIPVRRERASTAETEGTTLPSDTDSIVVIPLPDIHNDVLIAEDAEETDSVVKDSIIEEHLEWPLIQSETHYAESVKKKKNWQFLAAGSLGPALAQATYKMISTGTSEFPISPISSDIPEPDGQTLQWPDYIGTWEDFGKHLRILTSLSPDGSVDTLALIDIADHNTGKIEEQEQHDRPVTLGISLTKSLTKKWSIETGLQYSLLNSRFRMGENGYSITAKQRVHYLGIPLRASYNWLTYKHLSAYSTAGVTLHIPILGKKNNGYLVGWQNVYSEEKRFTPPLQWQAGISFGMQYQFAPHTSLFAEPTFNWFIPSGSDTHTIWTEHPFMFTCPFGVRITW